MALDARTERTNRQRLRAGILLLAVFAIGFVSPGTPAAGPETERLSNGSFEDGFRPTPLGEVAAAWLWFHNGGAANYEFYRDTWAPVVYDGGSSQLIEINTYGLGGQDADRYAGIYQTVAVVPGEVYVLTVRGMLRALEDDPDRVGYNYRVQYGIDYDGGTDWRLVADWVEIPWNDVYPRLSPGPIHSYSASVKASSSRMTVYVRVWKKWPSSDRVVELNLDGVSLSGAHPGDVNRRGEPGDAATLTVGLEVPEFPVAGQRHVVNVQGTNEVGVSKLELYDNGSLVARSSYKVGRLSTTEAFVWRPASVGRHVLKAVSYDGSGAKAVRRVQVRVGASRQFLTNGGFEKGFRATPVGMVGQAWGWFHSGGRANYAFYDDTWSPVVYGGSHSQLIGINSIGWSSSDSDRYAGIYQSVGGLTEGADYAVKVRGMLRGQDGDPDRNWLNYRVEWGYAPAAEADWRSVSNWSRIPWDEVYPLLEPGGMLEYRATFKAPASKVTLFFRVWKLWATPDREIDVNLDGISLVGYQ